MRNLLFILPLLFALTGCDNLFLETQKYTLLPPKTPAGQQCAKQCPAGREQCLRNCEALKNNCLHAARENAQKSFLQYVNDRMAQGLLVDKKESDFYAQASVCPEMGYCQESCEINMRSCHSLCGGEVKQNGNCLANCGKTLDEMQDETKDDWF